MKAVSKLVIFLNILLLSPLTHADNWGNNFQGTVSKGTTAAAKKVMSYSNNTLDKLEFNFAGASAWLNKKGDWNIKGAVKHSRIRCASYQLGIRFGKGENGCSNAVWLTDYEYGTNVKHCNSAELQHTGGGYFSELENNINEVTCAQVDIKCFGSTCPK